jgi:hypothetical protein
MIALISLEAIGSMTSTALAAMVVSSIAWLAVRTIGSLMVSAIGSDSGGSIALGASGAIEILALFRIGGSNSDLMALGSMLFRERQGHEKIRELQEACPFAEL